MNKVTYNIDVDGFHGEKTLVLSGINPRFYPTVSGTYLALDMSDADVREAEKSVPRCGKTCLCGGYPFPNLASTERNTDGTMTWLLNPAWLDELIEAGEIEV